MKKSSPLLLDLDENDPGILVVQSTHKQQAGFSQASQIHKKDKHIKGQKRISIIKDLIMHICNMLQHHHSIHYLLL